MIASEEKFSNDARFGKLTNYVDLCIHKLPFTDIIKYTWGITVLGLNDTNKYTNILNTYSERLSQHKNSMNPIDKLSISHISNLIWTCGCIKDTIGISNNTLIAETTQELNRIMNNNDNTLNIKPISSSLSVRVLWSLALHNIDNPDLTNILLNITLSTEKPSDLSTDNTLTLLWALSQLPTYHHTHLTIELLETILSRLHTTAINSKSSEYKQLMKSNNLLPVLLLEVLQRYHSITTTIQLQQQEEEEYHLLLRSLVHKITETLVSKIKFREIKQYSVVNTILILQSLRIIYSNRSTSNSISSTSSDTCGNSSIAAIHNNQHYTKIMDACLRNLLAAVRENQIEFPALLEIIYSIVSDRYSITGMYEASMEADSSSNEIFTLEEEGYGWCEVLNKHRNWQQLLGILTTQCIEYNNNNMNNNNTTSIDIKSILYTTNIIIEYTGYIHETLLVSLSNTIQTNKLLTKFSTNMLKTLATILKKAIVIRKQSENLKNNLDNTKTNEKWKSKLFLKEIIQELLYRCQQSTAANRSILWKIEVLEIIAFLTQVMNEMKESNVRGFRHYDSDSTSFTQDKGTWDRVTPAAADTWSTTGSTGSDSSREMGIDTAPSWLKEDLAAEEDSTAAEPGAAGGHSARPYKASFEEEEGLVRHGDRLAALVAAASGRIQSNNDAVDSAISESSTRTTDQVDVPSPVPHVHNPEAQYHEEVRPDTPQQVTETTRPVEQPIPLEASFDAAGYAILSVEEDEGMSTDTDRLKALVAAAANKQSIATAKSVSTPKSDSSDHAISSTLLDIANTSYESKSADICFIPPTSITNLSSRLLQRLYNVVQKSSLSHTVVDSETITVIHKEMTKRGLNTTPIPPGPADWTPSQQVSSSNQRPSFEDLSSSPTRFIRILNTMTSFMRSLYREEFHSIDFIHACESAISTLSASSSSSSSFDETQLIQSIEDIAILEETKREFSIGELEGLLLLSKTKHTSKVDSKQYCTSTGTSSTGSNAVPPYDSATTITIDSLFNMNKKRFSHFIRSYNSNTNTTE